jgi:hypothetical protein
MFHNELYPTPIEVLEMMQLDCKNKIILEPHAGFGNIVDYCKNNGAKEVIAIEINERCREILKPKCQIIGSDFFKCTSDMISHVNAIYMNPPFSNADKHIIHAWEIAPDGCEIISLCNYTTISLGNTRISRLIRDYGNAESLGDCFSDAERKTNVEVGLIRLYKPVSKSDFEFEGFFMDQDEEEEQSNGIMQYNEVRALVNRYVGTMKAYDTMMEQVENVNGLIKGIGMSSIDMKIGFNDSITTKEQFSKILQKRSWNYIFNKMNMQKYVTSGVMRDINKFVETQEKIPFTMKNIYRMLEIIVGTRGETFNRALEEAIDNFTKYTHENRFGVEGWKTNSGYMLNKKFIVDGIIDNFFSNFDIKYDSYGSRKIDDLVKVLCNITGKNYDSIGTLYRFNYKRSTSDKLFNLEPNVWYEWGFFEVKFFKKGTMHVKFKDLNDWYLLNKAYGELKGFTLHDNYR